MIKDRIKILSSIINNKFSNEKVHIVGLLDGCLPTLNELKINLTISFTIDKIKISSYVGMNQSEMIFNDNVNNIKDGDIIIIVDDIVDSGNTITFVKNYLNEKYSNLRISVFSLLVKKDAINLCDWYGFIVPDNYVIGYGMDIDNLFRDLEDIYILND